MRWYVFWKGRLLRSVGMICKTMKRENIILPEPQSKYAKISRRSIYLGGGENDSIHAEHNKMIGTRQKKPITFKCITIHDGATWPVLIVEIRSPFYQFQGFSHDDKFWNSRLGGKFITVKTYAARKEGVPVTKSRPFLSRNFSKHFPACKYLNLNHCTITCCWLELASNATNIRWQAGLQIVLGWDEHVCDGARWVPNTIKT